MPKFKKLQKRTTVVVVLVLVALGVVGQQVYARSGLPDGAAFRYAGRTVTSDQLDDRVGVLGALYGVKAPSDPKEAAAFERDAAKSMAVSLILDQEAVDHGIVISEKAAQDQLDKVIDGQLTGGREAFVEYLGTAGISERDVIVEIKRQLATSRLVEEVTADVPTVTEAVAAKAYDEHRADMVSPEQRRLSNIVVGSQADADRVLAAARRGTPFATLARTWSRDASTRDSGGDLGVLTADSLEKGYGAAAFAAAKGGLFGPVQTQYGWNVGKVTQVSAPVALSYAQVHDQLLAELQNKERLTVWRDWLATSLNHAHVEYADDFRPDHPDDAPATLPN